MDNEKLLLKKRKYNSLWLWCVSNGYEVQENKDDFIDAVFLKDHKTTGFVFEFDKTTDSLLYCIEKAKGKFQYLYVVIDDNAKFRDLKKTIPEFCGIFCNSDAFGLGMVTQILREAKGGAKDGK